LDGAEQQVVGIVLIFESEPSEADMVEVLEPFEEGNGYTTTVDEHIRHDQTIATFQKHPIGCRGGWAICCFSDYLNDKLD
jgi:hypothetical protein